jgi:hypothetical protein
MHTTPLDTAPSAQVLFVDGTRRDITPKNGQTFTFIGEAYDLIGASMIEIRPTHDGRWLLIDEEGKCTGKPRNVAATALYRYGADDPIVGDAMVCGVHQLD